VLQTRCCPKSPRRVKEPLHFEKEPTWYTRRPLQCCPHGQPESGRGLVRPGTALPNCACLLACLCSLIDSGYNSPYLNTTTVISIPYCTQPTRLAWPFPHLPFVCSPTCGSCSAEQKQGCGLALKPSPMLSRPRDNQAAPLGSRC